MKPEQIQDALSLLDEDLIEVVDVLRSKEEPKIPWIKYASLVACLCMVILGAGICINYGVDNFGKNTCDGVQNTVGNDKLSEGNTSNTGLDGENLNDQEFDGALDGSVNVGEVPSVLVRIDEWQAGGFVGVVAGIVDTDIFLEGARIEVIFDENISVGVWDGEGITKFEKGTPDETDFPVGSVVCVQFVKLENITDNSSNFAECRYIIYAEMIILAEAEIK